MRVKTIYRPAHKRIYIHTCPYLKTLLTVNNSLRTCQLNAFETKNQRNEFCINPFRTWKGVGSDGDIWKESRISNATLSYDKFSARRLVFALLVFNAVFLVPVRSSQEDCFVTVLRDLFACCKNRFMNFYMVIPRCRGDQYQANRNKWRPEKTSLLGLYS